MKYLKIACISALISYVLLNILIFNLTDSVPVGLYLNTWSNDIKVNDYVRYKPTGELLDYSLKKGYLLNGMSYIKIVAAGENDIYCVINEHLYINTQNKGRIYPNDLSKLEPNKLYCVSKGNVLLLTSHPFSFDSRYYGEISTKDLIKIIPLFIKGQAACARPSF